MVAKMTMVVLLVVVVVCGGAEGQTSPKHGWDNSCCQQQQTANPGSLLPKLPESFSVRVEVNLLKKNKTTTLHEYFDYNANVAAVRQIENGVEEYAFYLYNSNQFLTVAPDLSGGTICFSQDLSANGNNDLFGLKKINSTTDRVYTVYGALHFGGADVKEQYQGQEIVRGVPCNKWTSCQYWADMDATSSVTWYFSDQRTWQSISTFSAPVRCHVTGKRWVNGTSWYSYEHIYDFYDFTEDVSGTENYFEVPRNTYCLGSKNTKPLPSMPVAYTFDSEVLDMNTKSISFVREEYDNMTKLLRFDYRNAPQANSPFDTRYVTQIHDFNTGVAYLIDVFRANCTVMLMMGADFDDAITPSGKLRLRNPNEFMDLNHKFIYQGVRTIRGVECDTWAAERFDFPIPTKKNQPSTWTWYFATANWLKKMGFRGDNLVLPVHMEIFSDTALPPVHKQQSFFEYNAEQPNILSWDISSCYGVQHSRNFAFLVSGRLQDLAQGDVKVFKYYMLTNLMSVLGVSPLRISKMDVQEAGSDTLVSFDLLDKAPLTGDVATPPNEPDLDTAYKTLSDAVNGGQLKFLIFSNLDKVPVKPVGSQYQDLLSRGRRSANSDLTVTGGAMGGMAVGMLILGALVGFAVMFLVYRIRGGTFGGGIPMKRFNNDQDQVVSNDA